MKISHNEIRDAGEPEQTLHAVAPYMPQGQRRQIFYGEFDTDDMVEAYLKRNGIIPPVHWRVSIGNDCRDGFWGGDSEIQGQTAVQSTTRS